MDEVGLYRLPVAPGLALEVVEQAVEQGAGEVAVAGMDHQSGLFVHNQHIIVFVYRLEGDGLRQQLGFVRRLGQHDADEVAGFYFVVRFGGFAVHQHAAGFGGGLYLGARDALQPHLQVFVEPQHRLTFVYLYAVVLKQLLLVWFKHIGVCGIREWVGGQGCGHEGMR